MAALSALRCATLLGALIALGDSAALADPAEAVHFLYESPASCPTESQFVEAVRLDGATLARAREGASARELRVRLTQSDQVIGQVVVVGLRGREAVRTIAGAHCEDVARALAVFVALALEPAPGVSKPEPPPPPVGAPAPIPTVRAHPLAGVDATPAPAEALEPLPPGWRLGVSAEGTVSGLGSIALGVAAYLEMIHDVPEGFAPALRLGVEIAHGGASTPASGPFGQGDETVSLTRRVVRLDLCPVRAIAARPWSPSPIEAWVCARLDAGVLDAIATSVPGATDAQRAWMAAGSVVHVRWVMRRFFAGLEGGIALPLLRERFTVEPSTVVYRVPAVTGAGGLALGGYFL